MTQASREEVTGLLQAWSGGDQDALEKLMPLVYAELHRLAKRYMGREHVGRTLQTSALVNEAYLRLVDAHGVRWQNRAHFFAVAAQAMRRVLVEHARSRQYAKRGGTAQRISLDDVAVLTDQQAAELVALDDALTSLEALDARKARIVELRYIGGLSIEESAETLGVSTATVERDWRSAKAWLYRAISQKKDT